MQTLAKIGLLALLSAFALTPNADAQTYEEHEAEQDSSQKKSKKRPEVREIVKGTYAKTNVGAGMHLGRYAPWVKPGTSIALAIGQDFMDQQKLSMAWEISFFQGINNAAGFAEQAAAEPAACYDVGSCIQGDLRTYTFLVLYEASFYPTRRIGIGIRGGGGVLFSPLLMDEKYYQDEVVAIEWKGNRPAVHDEMHPAFVGGPTLEYYTKLSHFSMGVDTDILYAVGFDLTASITGTLKYTF
jgi:hypothetical protein